MNYIKNLFSFYSIKYFAQSYLVSICICFLYLTGRNRSGVLLSMKNLPELLFLVFSILLYPFGKATYLYIKNLLIPEGVVYINYVVIILFAKLFMAMILYIFAIPLGVLNIIIIVVRYKLEIRKAKQVEKDIEWFE